MTESLPLIGAAFVTGLLGSANMGGFFAAELAWAGFHHLVIRGRAEKPVYLFIHDGEIEIRDAGDVWGLSATESQWAIRKELGDEEVKACVIGQAGEEIARGDWVHTHNLVVEE